MSLEIESEEAWNLMKKIRHYKRYKQDCLDVEVLQLLKDGASSEEIIDKIVEIALDEY